MIRRDVEKSLRNMFERGYKQGYENALKENALKENKGEWECCCSTNSGVYFFECSCCHTTHADNSDFCPNCGADMRGE